VIIQTLKHKGYKMKITNIALSLALLGTLSLGMADDTTTTTSVDSEIAAIQAAPAQERVQLMNQFKERLASMNEADRAAAITQLRTQMQTQAQDTMAQAEGTAAQTRTQAQEMQMQTNEQMNQMQNMNQQRFGNQVINMGSNTPANIVPATTSGSSTTMPAMSR
jgi:hypothetical protein